MAVITPDRFDPIKAFCNVRLQQGVPLVDADVNELDDIRKFEVRAFLKWFVGDGVPEGNDGFRIDAATPSAVDNFTIASGAPAAPSGTSNIDAGLRHVGRCIVDGLDVIIKDNTSFKAQPLHPSRPDAAAQAARLGGPVISMAGMDATGPVTLLVYLDVWERVVKPEEDKTLIVPPLATETCARVKREWVVRTLQGTSLPAPSEGHSYYGLARINRRADKDGKALPILQTDITDLRERGLVMQPATLITDVLGVDPAQYRRGNGRPAVSLRGAINSLLRGEPPGTDEQAIPSGPGIKDTLFDGAAFDSSGGTVLIWQSQSFASSQIVSQIVGSRLGPKSGVFSAPITLATDPLAFNAQPNTVALPNGDLMVAYRVDANGVSRGFFRHDVDLAGLQPLARETAITSGVGVVTPRIVVVPAVGGGGHVVFLWYSPVSQRILFRRRLYDASWQESTATWVAADGPGAELSPTASGLEFHAAVAPDGNVWVAFTTNSSPAGLQVVRITPSDVNKPLTGSLVTGAFQGGSTNPFVTIDGNGIVSIFHTINEGIRMEQYQNKTATKVSGDVVAGAPSGAFDPRAVVDRHNGIWLFWSYGGQIMSARRTSMRPMVGFWGPPRALSAPGHSLRSVLLDSTGALWLFGDRPKENYQDTNPELFFRRILTEI